MTSTLSLFQESRQKLKDAALLLSQLDSNDGNFVLKERASAIIAKIDAFSFNIVVLGEFKRGKSTLINALIGASVLPTATIPLTSVATIIQYGKKPQVRVFLNSPGESDNVIEIDLSRLEEYVTERSNPVNRKGVSKVEIEYPSQLLLDGVRIVDTPGTGSVYAHNTATTHNFLPETDAAIFVFSADQPASRSELDLLHEVQKFAAKLIFVQNKVDHLDASEKVESLSFLERTLENELGTIVRVFPLSARIALGAKETSSKKETVSKNEPASQQDDPHSVAEVQLSEKLLECGFSAFEDYLYSFLSNEKAALFLHSVQSRLLLLCQQERQFIELERRMALKSAHELEQLLEKFRTAAKQISRDQKDADYIVEGEAAELIEVVAVDLRPVAEMQCRRVEKIVEQAYAENKQFEKQKLISKLLSVLKETIELVFNEWRISEDEKVNAHFALLTGRFVERGNRLVQDIQVLTREIFELEISIRFEIEPISTKSTHYYAVDNPFALSAQMIPLLLPDFLSKPLIISRLLRVSNSELRRNSGRLRADYQQRIHESARIFLRRFHQNVSGALLQIEVVVERALQIQASSVDELARHDSALTKQLDTLNDIESKLLLLSVKAKI